jgi:FHA domain
MNPLLRVISGPTEGSNYQLIENEITVGREPSNHICITDPLISRRHCRIVKRLTTPPPQYWLLDGNSINGTQVNGVRIKEHLLAHRDVIKVGKISLLFLCHEEDDSPPDETTVEFEDDTAGQRPIISFDREKSRYLDEKSLQSSTSAQAADSQLMKNFQKLLRIGLELNSQRNLSSLQQRLFELIREAVPAERGAILLVAAATNEIKSFHNWNAAKQNYDRFKVSNTVIRKVVTESKAILSNNVALFNREPSRSWQFQ